MKRTRLILGITASAIVLISGCSDNTQAAKPESKPVVSLVKEEQLGLRKSNLYTEKETVGSKTDYVTDPAGASHPFERAFENAPPMIPHDISDYVPITREDNQCIGCHDPMVAQGLGAKSYPKSHQSDFRPKAVFDHGNVKNLDKSTASSVEVKDLGGALSQARFNCTQCHAPQSQGALAVDNTFKPDFTSDTAKSKSNLIDVLNEGVE